MKVSRAFPCLAFIIFKKIVAEKLAAYYAAYYICVRKSLLNHKNKFYETHFYP